MVLLLMLLLDGGRNNRHPVGAEVGARGRREGEAKLHVGVQLLRVPLVLMLLLVMRSVVMLMMMTVMVGVMVVGRPAGRRARLGAAKGRV